ncbi:hypothetical protein [Solilutibacter silvestris]|uniref:hypothetical protein n=1 Tax=Solilutibacter silvestris TaxID=1645665 RepID=UPI003D33AB61
MIGPADLNPATLEERAYAWFAKFVWHLVLLAMLCGSLWLNLDQYGKAKAAKAECKAGMFQAASIAIQNERDRAAKADKQAAEIADKAKAVTAKAVATDQGKTNERSTQIHGVQLHGDCRVPVGMPDLSAAAREANAAARLKVHR